MDRRRNAESKYKEEICGRCNSPILYLPGEKPKRCPDCEWAGQPWSDKANAPATPYDIPAEIKVPVPYSGPADGL